MMQLIELSVSVRLRWPTPNSWEKRSEGEEEEKKIVSAVVSV